MEPRVYDRYHKYVRPSFEAYERAIAAGQKPTTKELDMVRWAEGKLAYELSTGDVPFEEQIKLISGYEKLGDFQFHDSQPVWFEQGSGAARLDLFDGSKVATFTFDGVSELDIHCDPDENFIFEFK